MAISELQIDEGITTLPDRYVPRFEVFIAKPEAAPTGPAEVLPPIDPGQATAEEKARLDSLVFVAPSGPNAPTPKLAQLVPLAGPWGEKSGQRTDDIVSVEFTESISEEELPLAEVKIEVVNVYDFERQYYRYTDIPPNLAPGRTGVFPILDYGDTLALRFGYGTNLDWVFDGIVTEVSVDFPADGDSRVSVHAVDKRDRLRAKRDFDDAVFGGASEEQLAARLASRVGLRVAAPPGQTTTAADVKKSRPADQDVLTYLTDRAKKAQRELLCFGNTLYVMPHGDNAKTALRYVYRRGLSSFTPTFNGTGKATSVIVESRDPKTQRKFSVTVTSEDLQNEDLIPEGKPTALESVKDSGQAGERPERVTNYLAQSPEEARRLAIGILKRNLDKTITATGSLVGDPRVRARSTLRIDGVGRFSGFWYVTSVTHRFGAGGYQTEFNARRNTALDPGGTATR